VTGTLLHLSGPLQAWGSASPWNERETEPHPTRSALLGMIAAVIGLDRDQPLDRLTALTFTVRIDRPGKRIMDFHTVGGGRPADETPMLARLKHRPEGKGTVVSERYYLSDAAFTVAVTADDAVLLEEIARRLTQPVYAPFLGRRSCPPAGVLVLGRHEDPVTALFETVPLARNKPRQGDTVPVDFITETAPAAGTITTSTELPTNPLGSFRDRAFARHTTWRTTHQLPAALCGSIGLDYLNRLTSLRDAMAGAGHSAAEHPEEIR
jgi:CRISPR system Cascade subunit CasD